MEDLKKIIIRTDGLDLDILKKEIFASINEKDLFLKLSKTKKKIDNSYNSSLLYAIGVTDQLPDYSQNLPFYLDADLPDCDVDFQDTKRDMLLGYLKEKYGDDCVAKLGTISKYKADSTLNENAKVLGIPLWEIKDLKESLIKKDAGDQRGLLADAFEKTAIGKKYLEKFPNLEYSKLIEGHSRHYGQHAAAVIVSAKPLYNYCTIDYLTEACQLDKTDAESINLLKVDCLGLSTLTIVQDVLDKIGKDRDWIVNYPLDDQKAFDVINSKNFCGIFQFEGDALMSLSKKINIQEFIDICAITSLARPATLISGEAARYAENKLKGKIQYAHPILEKFLKETYGVIVYQEQVMQIVKEVGNFSWEDTSRIRKAIGKSMGADYINKMQPQFIKGCKENNVDEESAEKIWNAILDMGSYAFNKSHAVAYSMLSYWCMVLKAYHPLEFARAILTKSESDATPDKAIQLLKELSKEGYEFKTFDRDLSEASWSIKDGILIGGFRNLKGVGEKKAQMYVDKRNNKKPLTANQSLVLHNAETPYDDLFEFKSKFSGFYDNFELFVKQKPILIKNIEEINDEVRFLGKSIKVKLKNLNDPYQVEKRDGILIEEGKPLNFVDVTFADDSESINCRIKAEYFEALGKSLLDDKLGSYYIVGGQSCKGFRYVMIHTIKKITPEKVKEKIIKKSI